MRISVAMAVYNGEKYILDQLDSIRSQTRPVDEVIISDDFSTDNTMILINNFIEKFRLHDSWKCYNNSNSKGVAGNFHNAISKTSGEIVILCDQDDIWLREKVTIIEEAFLKHPDVGCINSSFRYIDGVGTPLQVKSPRGTSNNGLILQRIDEGALVNIPLSVVYEKNISPGMTIAVKRDVIEKYLHVSRKEILHDWEINCIAASQNKLYFLNRVLVLYRIHSKQTVSIGNIKKRTMKEILLEKINSAESTVAHRKVMIDELTELDSQMNNRYVLKQKELNLVRERVLRQGLSLYIFKELELYVALWIKYRTIDFRYFAVDIIHGLVKSIGGR